MKQLDPIKELYGLYLEEEDSPKIVELGEETDLDLCHEPPLWALTSHHG